MPLTCLQGKTPFVMLFSKSPKYTQLQIMGCLCCATKHSSHHNKFDPQGTKCIPLGYNQGQKAYRLFDPISKQIIFSRDVVFCESMFPFYMSVDGIVSLDFASTSAPTTANIVSFNDDLLLTNNVLYLVASLSSGNSSNVNDSCDVQPLW